MSSLAYAALWIFVFTVPWENVFVILPGVSVIVRATGMLALASALVAAVITARVRRWHLLHVAALLFVCWAGFCLLTKNIQSVPKKYWTFVQLFAMIWMIWELAPSRRRQLGLLTAYVLGAYISAVATILVFRRHGEGMRRFAAGAFDANDLAMTLALALPMAWYLGMTYRQPLLRWLCRAYVPVALVAIGLTGSRGGMLVTVVALLVVPLTMTKMTPGRLAAAIGILGLSGILAVTYIPDTIVKRLATTGTEVEDARLGGRFKLWVAGMQAFVQKPVMGYGTSGFKAAVAPKLGLMTQVAHNSYISVLVEEGAVGLLLYLTMFIALLRSMLRLPRLERRFALILLASLGIAMLPLTWEDHKVVWFIMAALLGLSQSEGAGTRGAVRSPSPPRTAPMGRVPMGARPPRPLTAPGRNADREATG
jgi:O-antigen ligase